MRRATSQRGVTLIELMVGMLIGMLAILVISQVLLVSEGQKRTTTSGADAQVNGALSLFAIQRDIQSAGYGFTSSPAIVGCPVTANFNGAVPAGFPATLAPLFITSAAARGVGRGPRRFDPHPLQFQDLVLGADTGHGRTVSSRKRSGWTVPVTAALGYHQRRPGRAGHRWCVPCSLLQVTGTPSAMASVHAPIDNAGWNTAGTPTQAYGDGSVLLNLGSLIDNRYEVNIVNNQRVLQLSSFDICEPRRCHQSSRDVQADVVTLRAYYGRDTSNPTDGIVDVYDSDHAHDQRRLAARDVGAADRGCAQRTVREV